MINRLNKNKRANISQSFTFFSAAIIMGVILIFGSMSVFKLMKNTNDITSAQFKSNLENEIDKISSKYGSEKVFDLTGLKKYDQICVFDLNYQQYLLDNADNDKNPCGITSTSLLRGDIEDETANFFLLNDGAIEERFLNNKITLENEPFCICHDINDGGTIKIKLEGLGKSTLFSFVE